jgi:hypothetical protein
MQVIDMGRREYPLQGFLKTVYFLGGLGFCGFGVFKLAQFLPRMKSEVGGMAGLDAMMIGILLVSVALGLYLILSALRTRLLIDGTRIAVRSAFLERSADFSEVQGFRAISTRNGTVWRIELKQGLGSITIPGGLVGDELRVWFQQLMDLDRQGR